MNIRKILQQMACLVLVMLFLVGCGAYQAAPLPEPTDIPPEPTATQLEPTATPGLPTKTPNPTSCQEVDGTCLELSFDGETCTYTGPTDIKSGSVTLLIFNETEEYLRANMVRHTGGATIQDMIDNIGEEPTDKPPPSWAISIHGVWKYIYAGDSYTWKGVLEPGIHTMVCAKSNPHRVWFGGGFTVED